jgi:hypothetical protein
MTVEKLDPSRVRGGGGRVAKHDTWREHLKVSNIARSLPVVIDFGPRRRR